MDFNLDFNTVKIVLLAISILASLYLLPRYKHIPAVNLTLLCFIIFQFIISSWYDFLFLAGVAFVLSGINIEYIKLYNKAQELEKKLNAQVF